MRANVRLASALCIGVAIASCATPGREPVALDPALVGTWRLSAEPGGESAVGRLWKVGPRGRLDVYVPDGSCHAYASLRLSPLGNGRYALSRANGGRLQVNGREQRLTTLRIDPGEDTLAVVSVEVDETVDLYSRTDLDTGELELCAS